MIRHTPQLVMSRTSSSPQWQPVSVGHAHHVPTDTIASSVALFNQSTQTADADLQRRGINNQALNTFV